MPSFLSPRFVGTSLALTILCTSLAAALLSGCGSPRPDGMPGAGTTTNSPAQELAAEPGIQPEGPGDVPPLPAIPPARKGEFVGSDACRECHRSEFEEHQSSSHAHTLARMTDPKLVDLFRSKQKLVDPVHVATYTVSVDAGKPTVHVAFANEPPMQLDARYAVGSGKRARTFLFQNDEERRFMESRLSHYTNGGRFDWTLGQHVSSPKQNPIGRLLHSGPDLACFVCHSTMVVMRDDKVYPEESMFNVGCERCHGAGREHIRLAKAGRPGKAIFGFKNAKTKTMVRLCGDCHRSPGTIKDEDLETSKDLPRFAGTALAASRCFRESPDGLACTSCHNPHQKVSEDMEGYVGVCAGCHSPKKAGSTICPVNPKGGCIPCHMPAVTLEGPGANVFRTHWIRPYPDKGGKRPPVHKSMLPKSSPLPG
jgi:hypothetical protein